MLLVADELFLGANTAINPKKLGKGFGVNASSLDTSQGDFRGRRAALSVHTLTGYSSVQQHSLYRFGRETPSDTQYWFAYASDVDFARSLLASDPLERTYGTGGVFTAPVYTDSTFVSSAPYGQSGYALGISVPGSGMTATVATAGTGTNEERVYVSTFLRYNDDESAPSPPTTIVCPKGSTVTLAAFPADPAASIGADRRNIYVSTDGGDFRLCVDGIDLSDTTSTDTGTRGAILQTGGATAKPAWLPPPDAGYGLIELWNGMHGLLNGKQYMACVPYNPHAWPVQYRRQVPDTIVGSAKWGQSWLLATTGIPRVVEGRAPEGMQDRPIPYSQSCVSKRSVVGVGHGVCWAGPNGLAYYGQHGALNLTANILTEAQWRALVPSTIIGAHWGQWYIGFYNDGTRKCFMIDTVNPTGLIWIPQGAYAVFTDPAAGLLYILDSGNVVRKWDADTVGSATFKSRVNRLQFETNPAVAKIVATTYPVTFSMWCDGTQRVTSKSVTSDEPFRLPSGYRCEELQYEIIGAGPVEGVFIGEQVGDLP